ncbi:isochorismatase family protein [Saccharospirillum sp.]|uniref:isochorismatase family protein n=1 Tax=Saccharospirillum sp. TaxID=2033801 RepID=UPI0034A0162F
MPNTINLEPGINPSSTAVLFFDFLNGHVKDSDRVMKARYVPVIAAASALLATARQHRLMVAYAQANHRADNATTAHTLRDTNNRLQPLDLNAPPELKPVVAGGSWQAQTIDELAPRDEDYLIPKYRWSAFHQTYLELALRTRGIDTLILAGGSTDVGVASTAYAARDLDFNLVIARDACTSNETDNHDQFMDRIFPRMSRVRTVSDISDLLTR